MDKRIVLSKSSRAELVKLFRVSEKALSQALNYHTNSPLAKTLRAAAKERRRLEDCNIKGEANCESAELFTTYFNEVPHQMIQVFSPRVKLVCDLENTGDVQIWVDGNVNSTYKRPLVQEMPMLQAAAKSIVEQLN